MPEEKRTVILGDELDLNFRNEIAAEPGGEQIRFCFQCGTCTASCPVRAVEDRFNPRRIIRMSLLGMKQEVLKEAFVWLCSSCYACQERCPQGVKITGIMGAIKNIAVKNKLVPAMFAGQVATLKAHGRVYEVGDLENDKRAKLGLPQIKEMPDEVRKLLEMTGAEELAKGGQSAEAPAADQSQAPANNTSGTGSPPSQSGEPKKEGS